MKKACILITGQMRSFESCFNNIFQNLISPNENEYEFHIHILTEYFGTFGGTTKNNYINKFVSIIEFENRIRKIYHKYLQTLMIENDSWKINYPDYLNKYGPWICLYRNEYLFDKINDISQYDIFIRMRPDIVLNGTLHLKEFKNIESIIYIMSGFTTRVKSWLHNRDWDHMCISGYQGMKIWNKYHTFLQTNPPLEFDNEIRFNNKGYWVKYENRDKSIIATQLFFQYVIYQNFKLVFDAMDIFTNPIR